MIVDSMNPDDRIRFVAFNNPIREVSPQWYAPDDLDLIYEVMTVGQAGGTATEPSFRTSGSTNGTAALQGAYELMVDSNFPEEIPRRPVAIYMTDGVSNQVNTNSWNSVPSGTTTNYACDDMPPEIEDYTAWCQLGYHEGKPRPVQQMILTSEYIHTNMQQRGYDDFVLYVVAMGRLDTGGMDQVATDPSKVYRATDSNELEHLLQNIQQEVDAGGCLVRSGEPVTWIAEANKPDPSLTGDPDVFGFVDITQNGTAVKIDVPIVNNAATGRLGFDIPPAEGLSPGTYEITNPRLYYRLSGEYAAQDGELYNRILLNSEYIAGISFTVGTNTPGDTVSAPDMTLDINETRLGAMCDSPSNPEPIPATDPVVQLTDSSGSALPTAQDITDAAQTDFRAIAYDREIGSTDGAGINRAELVLLDPNGAPLGQPAYDTAAPYCPFGDTSGTCNPMPAALYTQVTENPGTYTLRARTLLAGNGQQTAWEEASFTTTAPLPEPDPVVQLTDSSGSALPTAQNITDVAQTDFRAIAYDREVGSTDGAGISQAEFTLLDPSGAPLDQPTYDTAAPYCPFGDTSGTCDPMPAALYTQVTENPGTYTLRARTLLAGNGQQTAWEEASFTTESPVQPQPQVTINFSNGRPGSVFVITGSNFPANAQLSVGINGTQGSTFSADANGAFILVIITSPDATPGTYAITLSTGPVLARSEMASAQVSYTLATDAPLREHTAAPGETVIELDITPQPASTNRVYLPAVQR
jgi:hypothetical protein